MGLFGFGKKNEVVDLGERYRRKQEASQAKVETSTDETQTNQDSGVTAFPFFAADTAVETTEDNTGGINSALDPAEKRRRLAKRLKDMTDRMEDLSNQIYHLQQRIEVLERKI